MSWYEEAASELWNAGALNLEGIISIIERHDPNRWVPVEERLPKSTGDPFRRVHAVRNSGSRVIEAEPQARNVNVDGWDFWREINLPEVKG